ncbi:MAG: LamG-like jellyroll fold domain-containing protein [Segetibacter sp.]
MQKLFPIYLWMLLLVQNSYGQSLHFNGSNNYVNLGNGQALHLTSFTLEAWVKPENMGIKVSSGRGGTTSVPIITKGRGEDDFPSNVNVNYFLGINSDKKLTGDFEEVSGRNHPVRSNTSIFDGVWTHVAVTYEPKSAVWKLYINGKLDTTMDLGSNIFPASVSIQPASIASSFDSKGISKGYYNGKIDEVRIWKTVRTSTDILNNFKSELISGTGLIARYSFNQDSGITASNSIAASVDGQLINYPGWTNDFNNSAPFVPVKTSPTYASSAHSAASASLCATVNDKNNDKLRVRFYGRKKLPVRSLRLYCYRILNIIQVKNMVGVTECLKVKRNGLSKISKEKNIVYVGQLGDCTDHGDAYEVEWKRADTAMSTIENPTRTSLIHGIPYGICVGNHDQSPKFDPNGTTTFYNKYFGTKRFEGRSYYGGHNGFNNDNHYQLFSASGIDFSVICFEYDQTSGFSAAGGALDWGEKLIKSNPGRKVIVLTHWVLNENETFSMQGKAIYDRYKVYPNFLLLAGGHVHEVTGEAMRSDTYNGHKVSTILQDYQFRTNGGNGLMRIYEFDPSADRLSVKSYTPYANTYETDADSQFDLSVDLNSAPHPYAFIGEVTNVKPASNVCVTWSSLQQNEDYEWYAKVFDGEKTTTSPVWSISTQTTNNNLQSKNVEKGMDTGEQKLTFNSQFTIYPNPNNTNHLTLSLNKKLKGPLSVEVFDISGGLQFKKEFNATGNVISFEHHLSNGTYIVMVKTETTLEKQES